MSMSVPLSKSITIGGKSFSDKQTLEGDAVLVVDVSIPAAKTGQLTTRTDNDTGTLTLEASHGVTTGALLHIFWIASGVQKRTVCPAVGTVSGVSVPIDNCTGDVLPANLTNVTVMVPTVEAMVFEGDDAQTIAMFCESDMGTIILENDLTRTFDLGDQAYVWHEGQGDANPIAGDSIATVTFSHGDSTAAMAMRVGVLYSS